MAQEPVAKALDDFKELMRRPHRRETDPGIWHAAKLYLLSILPVVFVLLSVAVLPTPDPVTVPALPDGAGAAVEAFEDGIADRLTGLSATDGTLKAYTEALGQVGTLKARLADEAVAAGVAEQTAWLGDIRFYLALCATLLLALFTLAAQYTLVLRHWSFLWLQPETDLPERYAPRYRLYWVLALNLVLSFTLANALPDALFAAPTVKALTIAALASVLSAIFFTAYGTFLYALNFPPARKVYDILLALTAGDRNADPADLALKAHKSGDWKAAGILRVDPKLTARNTQLVIQALVRVLAVMMVVALVTVRLALDALPGTPGGTDLVKSGETALREGWLLIVGLGASITLAVIYGAPMARIGPFVSAEDTAGSASAEGWHITGDRKVKGIREDFDLTLARPKADPPTPFPAEMARALGADRAKFTTIMIAARHGGGFHSLFEDKLLDNLKQALTLLAPALAGSVLGFLG